MEGAGTGLQGYSFTQGIPPFDASAGVAEWQTSRAPMTGCSSEPPLTEKDGGSVTVNARAMSTMTACHLMGRL
jgi:hypothetical protein